MTNNVHLSKKDRITPEKMMENARKAKQEENLSPEDKVELMKNLVGNKGGTQDFLDKKKADATIKELRRQGKLK